MLPITCAPEIIAKGMEGFRKIFCRAKGFEHVCRFITGLILSPNKTLQGIYDSQVWAGGALPLELRSAVLDLPQSRVVSGVRLF